MRTYEVVKPNSLFFDFDKGLDRFFNSDSGVGSKALSKNKFELFTSEDSYQLAFEVPGFKKEDLKIELKDNKLSITGERKAYFNEDEKISITESFIIPKDTLQDQISVNLNDGVLMIKVPKDLASLESKVLEINN